MSAVPAEVIDCGETRTFVFQQTIPVQSYLIAIAIGNLVSKTLSPISKVWSEPEEIEKAAYEFEQVYINDTFSRISLNCSIFTDT